MDKKANDSAEIMLSSPVTNLKFTSFENAKKNIQAFANKNASEFGISNVPSSGGLFGLGSHRVTGDELNNVTSQVQGHLIKINGVTTEVIKEFGQVYTALESLDKEYIPAILSAVKGAELASNKAKSAADHAKVAQEDIKKTVEEQKKIIKILEKHKAKLERLKHLENVDDIWKASQELKEETAVFKVNINEAKAQLSRIDGNIKALQSFANGILDYEHLDDIDDIWDRVGIAEEAISSNGNAIEELLLYIASLKQIEHLHDVDTLWNNVRLTNTDVKQLSDRQSEDEKIIEEQGIKLLEIDAFGKELKGQNHLFNIDDMWNVQENHTGEFADINQRIAGINSKLDKLDLAQMGIQEFDSKLNSQKHLFDIDELWNEAKKTSIELSALDVKLRETSDEVGRLGEIQTSILSFKEKLEEQKQLYNIDGIHDELQHIMEDVYNLRQRVSLKEELNLIVEELNKEKKLHQDDVRILKKHIYISYGIAGAASIVGILTLILNIIGVI